MMQENEFEYARKSNTKRTDNTWRRVKVMELVAKDKMGRISKVLISDYTVNRD